MQRYVYNTMYVIFLYTAGTFQFIVEAVIIFLKDFFTIMLSNYRSNIVWKMEVMDYHISKEADSYTPHSDN